MGKSFDSFCKIDFFGFIDCVRMQSIIKYNYHSDECLKSIIMNANFDIVQTFGCSLTFYNILNDAQMNRMQIENILNGIHLRIGQNINSAKLIINNLLFGNSKKVWKKDENIWENV